MTKTKSTKRALLMSALSLLLCVSMLVGSTFAWFTDSVTSGSNVIQAGTLDIVMEYWDGDSWEDAEGQVLEFIKGGNYHGYVGEVLWEPGCTYELPKIRVRNEGNLAAKVLLRVNGITGDEKLLEAIEFETKVENVPESLKTGSAGNAYTAMEGNSYDLMYGTPDGTVMMDWTVMAKGHTSLNTGHTDTSAEFTISGHMKEEAGNEYQGLKIEGVSITALATQEVYEYDSFGREYDKNAQFPEVTVVSNAADLADALANGGNITLGADLFVDEKLTVASGKEVVLDLGGNELTGTFTQQGVSALIENKGTLTIKNGRVASLAENPDTDWNPEGFPTYASNTISNRGVLVVGDGAVIENQTNVGGASYAIDNYAGATLTVNDGEIKALDVAIRLNTASTNAANNVTINGGTITGKRAIWVHIAGSNAAQAPEVNLTINGGDFNSTSDLTIYSYSYGQSFANVKVNIAGGDFEKDVVFGAGYYGDAETLNITGGTFNGGLYKYTASDVTEDIAKP